MASEKTATLAPRTSKSASKSDDSLRYLPWLFLAPALVICTIVVVYPMVYSSYLSLFRWATWKAVGLPMLLYLAGLQTIPGELHEAAKVEGARPIQRFLYITFPLLRETTLLPAILCRGNGRGR
jgi:ABC-type sugar transport system permease subunit